MDLSGVGLPGLDALLLAGAVMLGAPWAARYTPRRAAQVEEVEEAETWTPHRVWQTYVGGEDGCVPGSFLTGVRQVEGGVAATIQLRGGKQHTGTALAARDLIGSAFASAMGLVGDCVVVDAPRSGRKDQAELLILHKRNPLRTPQKWAGPSLSLASGGAAEAAMFGDSTAARMAWFELGSGALNWLVAGIPGSGKTTFVTWLLAESAHATFKDATGRVRSLVNTVFVDGKGGQSIPEAVGSPGVCWSALWPEEWVRAILRVQDVMYARQRYMRRLRWRDWFGRERTGMGWWDPIVSGLPLLQLVIEEWPAVVQAYPWLAGVVHNIAKIGRSLGIRIVLVSQSITGAELGSTELRSVLTGNAIVFRTGDTTTAGMAFAGDLDVDVDPSALPLDMRGACFVKGPERRAAMARAKLVEDGFGWLASAPEFELAQVDVEAMGEDFALREERREFHDERGTDPQYSDEWLPTLAAHRGVSLEELIAELGGPTAGDGAQLPADPVPGPGQPAQPARSLEELIADAVAFLFVHGKGADGEPKDGREDVRTGELVEWLQGPDGVKAAGKRWSERSITPALKRTADAGLVTKMGHGRWRPVPSTPAESAAAEELAESTAE